MNLYYDEDEINCMFADGNNHLRVSLPPPRRPFANQRMDGNGNLFPYYCLVPDTQGVLAVVDVRGDNPQMVQGLVKAGKAYPVPISSEGVCQLFMEHSVLDKGKFTELQELKKKLVGDGVNLYHRIDSAYPIISFDMSEYVYHPEADYPENLIRHTAGDEKICSTFILMPNLVDGLPELVRSYFYSPDFITEMVCSKEVMAVPEHLTVYLKEVLEMKALGGERTYREACVALTDIPRNFPEGKFVEMHHLCQLRKLLNGGRIVY